eukprot:25546-Pelagococcus_subviridis.AAC.3
MDFIGGRKVSNFWRKHANGDTVVYVYSCTLRVRVLYVDSSYQGKGRHVCVHVQLYSTRNLYVYVYSQELIVVARYSVRPATRGCTRTRTPGPRVLSLSLSLALARVRAGSPPAAGGEIPSRARRAHSLWGARFLVPVRPRSRGERRCLRTLLPPPLPHALSVAAARGCSAAAAATSSPVPADRRAATKTSSATTTRH